MTRPLRVLLFSSLYPNAVQPTFGVFVETRLRELMRRHPVEARVVAPVPWFPSTHPRFGRYARQAAVPRQELRHGVPVLHPRYPLLPKIGLSTAPLALALACIGPLRRLQREGFDFDVIDAHFYHPDGAAAALLGRWFQRPVAATARGSDINLNGSFALPAATIGWTGRQIGASIGVSRALVDAMQRLGVPADRLHVLRNGVDTDRFAPRDPADCRQRLGLGPGPVLLAVANLVELKGHALMIDAMPQVLLQHPQATLVCVGEGEERPALQAQVAARGLQDRVVFAGARPNEQLADWYSAADVLLLASSREGWPNVLLEAMACGTPVIATRVGGTPEIVTDPAVGTLLPTRDAGAIARSVLDRLAAPADRAAVRRYAQGFGWAATSEAQYRLLCQLAGAAEPPAGPR